MLEEKDVFNVAEKIAAQYCKKFHAWSQFDEARQEAAFWLLKNRDKWYLPEKNLFFMGKLALVRWYQNAHNLRRRRKTVFILSDDFWSWGKLEPDRIEFFDLIDTAIRNAGLEKYRSYLIARAQDTTRRQALKLNPSISIEKAAIAWRRFKEEVKKLVKAAANR